MKHNYETYEIEIINEHGHIIHCHLFEGLQEEAEDNAKRSSKHLIGGPYEWRVVKIK